tara:strand:- start:918 stop:1031 length:114 start_codon:yes stop_codon:yes gene_type:complete
LLFKLFILPTNSLSLIENIGGNMCVGIIGLFEENPNG